jgi:glycerol-3-phosphate acyltransferase PlsY
MDWSAFIFKGLPFILLGYLIGSLPTSYLIVKFKTGYQLDRLGSGNLGARNLGRLLGRGWFVAVMLIDGAKGILPTLLALLWGYPGIHYFAALAAVAGHNYSVYIGFRGGRGIATSFGALAILSPVAMLLCLLAGGVALLLKVRVRLVNILMVTMTLPFLTLTSWLKEHWTSAQSNAWLNIALANGENIYLALITALGLIAIVLSAHLRDVTVSKPGVSEKMMEDMERARRQYLGKKTKANRSGAKN